MHAVQLPSGYDATSNCSRCRRGLRIHISTPVAPLHLQRPRRGITLCRSRRAAVCWPGASAPRYAQPPTGNRPAREGRSRLSKRTLAGSEGKPSRSSLGHYRNPGERREPHPAGVARLPCDGSASLARNALSAVTERSPGQIESIRPPVIGTSARELQCGTEVALAVL